MNFMMVRVAKILIKKVMKRMRVMMVQVKAGTETFLWQLEGSATITYGNAEQVRLRRDETLLLPAGEHTYSPSGDCLTLSCVMDPKNKLRPKNNQ